MCRRLIVIIARCDEECVEDLDLLDELTAAQREELIDALRMCIDRSSCNGFTTWTREP
jgi:hypothetical protein